MNTQFDTYFQSVLASLSIDADLLPKVDLEIDQFDQWSSQPDATLSPTATSCYEVPLDVAT